MIPPTRRGVGGGWVTQLGTSLCQILCVLCSFPFAIQSFLQRDLRRNSYCASLSHLLHLPPGNFVKIYRFAIIGHEKELLKETYETKQVNLLSSTRHTVQIHHFLNDLSINSCKCARVTLNSMNPRARDIFMKRIYV